MQIEIKHQTPEMKETILEIFSIIENLDNKEEKWNQINPAIQG